MWNNGDGTRFTLPALPGRFIDGERDAWILVAAELPEQMPLYMTLKQQQLDDPPPL